MSNVAFNATMNLLQKGFPKACLLDSFDAAMKYIRSMGLGYEKIHVCKNNCILFCKEKYVKLDVCLVCRGADSIWKDADTNKRVPQKVLRHFPLISRMKRMFLSSKIAKDARCHQSKRKPVNNELRHPNDGEALKEFNKVGQNLQKMLETLDWVMQLMVSVHLATSTTHIVYVTNICFVV
jgi:hypothetical protein